MQMGIDQSGSCGKGKVSNESKKSKRGGRGGKKKTSPVQKLYETCKEVFADCGPGIVPSPEKVEKLAAVLDGMSQADVGVRPSMPFFSSERSPIITYLHLHECEKFSIGIFCLPPGSVIPLHNHPGMTVFSKLLFGTMHIKAFDWLVELDKDIPEVNQVTKTDSPEPIPEVTAEIVVVPEKEDHPDGLRMARIKVNTELTAPCKTSILYPADGGNMHCFTAKTACAVLDVLGPPYCDAEGRHCQYYSEFPYSKFSVEGVSVPEEEQDGHVWLQEREKPKDLCLVGVPYTGPKISKK